MSLPTKWSTPEDFATLFKYFWHRDFPLGKEAVAAKRIDWTIHIGVVVRSIGDLMGLATRFETGGRKDAVLRSLDQDEIAIEWEWEGVEGNELSKLKSEKGFKKDGTGKRSLKYAVFVTYAREEDIDSAAENVKNRWPCDIWPLLLVLIGWKESTEFHSRRAFQNIYMFMFPAKVENLFLVAPALPWNVAGSRWCK